VTLRLERKKVAIVPQKSTCTVAPSYVTYTHQSYTPSYHTINTARAYTSRYVPCSSVSYPKSSVSPSCAAPASTRVNPKRPQPLLHWASPLCHVSHPCTNHCASPTHSQRFRHHH
jgi:hypothetical protein